MHLVQQILFILCAGISVYFFSKKVGEIRRNIKLGKDEDLTDNPSARWRNMVLMAHLQSVSLLMFSGSIELLSYQQ